MLDNPGQEDVEEEPPSTIHYRTPTGRMPRQWLIDRCDGNSRYNPTRRPPCFLCRPPFVLKWFPDCLEQNWCCERLGGIGCIDPDNVRARSCLFATAFVINVLGLFLLVVASFAMANERYHILWNISFTNVWLKFIMGPQDFLTTGAFYELGLRAAAFNSNIIDGLLDTGILSFADFCDAFAELPGSEQFSPSMRVFGLSYQQDYDCDACQRISQRIVPSLFLSMLSYIPNFTTDFLRMYANYDVNCQKFFGSVFSWISLATSIYTWVNYRQGCFDSLNTEPFGLDENFEKIDLDSEELFIIVQFQWKAGVGQICLALATFLKLVDIVINCVLPTPTITRDHLEQVEYEWKYGNREGCIESARNEENVDEVTPEVLVESLEEDDEHCR